ncbi:Nucleosome assembly protein (NAP) family protein [Leishmania donovani]|uniref:Nucleosome assembly protein (NAP) family protein n=1 Tax=Leishmania donovani TaxID=5661 RepID=A0A504XCB9_LEIDO|nr:Nucleosome assembly protein (NAP) family protein [Leishmania donovani]
MEKAKEIQSKLDSLQQEMHAKVEACDVKYSKEKNAIFAARRAAVAELIAKKEMPANFWALALIALLQMKDRESTTTPHFLGPYDEELLKTYLEDIEVLYTDKGHRITLRFKPNPFFEETELWAQASEIMNYEAGEEDEMPPAEESWGFSGVTWKDGHGPQLDEDEDEEDDGAPGKKRPHPSSGGLAASASSSTQGPSVLEEWEDEMADRKMLLRMVELFVHHNPVSALRDAGAATAGASNARLRTRRSAYKPVKSGFPHVRRLTVAAAKDGDATSGGTGIATTAYTTPAGKKARLKCGFLVGFHGAEAVIASYSADLYSADIWRWRVTPAHVSGTTPSLPSISKPLPSFRKGETQLRISLESSVAGYEANGSSMLPASMLQWFYRSVQPFLNMTASVCSNCTSAVTVLVSPEALNTSGNQKSAAVRDR